MAERSDTSSPYWARVTAVENGRIAALLITALEWVTFGFDLPFTEPRYRVLVGRKGTDDVVGVREARTKRRAERELERVQLILAGSTDAEARAALDLDF